MYLIKVELSLQNPAVRYALTNCQRMHNLTTKFFGTSRQESNILYRTHVKDNQVDLYMYADRPVDPAMCQQYRVYQKEMSGYLDQLKEGQVLTFDLLAMPSKKVSVEGKKNSQRRALRDPADRYNWLSRKAQQYGFELQQAVELEDREARGTHAEDKGGEMHHTGRHYRGTIAIRNLEAFKTALKTGIGPGKAYGYGMLLLR